MDIGFHKRPRQATLEGSVGSRVWVCVVMGAWEAKGFLPPNSAQTNNRAERLAVIAVLEHVLLQTIRLAVVMDSQYVYDGLRGSAFRWRTTGWVGQSGPVGNVDLWIRALDLVDRVLATVKWLRLPCHTCRWQPEEYETRGLFRFDRPSWGVQLHKS